MLTSEDHRQQRRIWNRKDYVKRKQRVIEYLGGRCVRCGSTENLEPDHRDSREKSFGITENINRRWEILVAELDKCQALCNSCHRKKSKECGEAGGGWNKREDVPHGTCSGYAYWKCRCDACKNFMRDYRRSKRQNPCSSTDELPPTKRMDAGSSPVAGTRAA